AGRETMLLTADAVDYGEEVAVEAKGKRDPVRAWPALRVAAGRSRPRSPLVGRARELELLADVLEHAIARREPQAFVVLGAPGIGKSRLAEEFGRRASGRATVL